MLIRHGIHLDKMIVGLALVFTSLIQPFSLCASVDTDSLMYEIHFPINSATVDTSFQQNDVTYRALRRLAGDTLTAIQKIDIRSWASPDGRRAFNLRLSENRAEATRRFILQTLPQAAGKTSALHQGEAWDLLRQHTVLDSTLDAESNARLRQILESDSPALTKKRAFRSLPFFGTLAGNLLPQLRKSLILIWVDRENASTTPPLWPYRHLFTPRAAV